MSFIEAQRAMKEKSAEKQELKKTHREKLGSAKVLY